VYAMIVWKLALLEPRLHLNSAKHHVDSMHLTCASGAGKVTLGPIGGCEPHVDESTVQPQQEWHCPPAEITRSAGGSVHTKKLHQFITTSRSLCPLLNSV
jgi:hypothetical protein